MYIHTYEQFLNAEDSIVKMLESLATMGILAMQKTLEVQVAIISTQMNCILEPFGLFQNYAPAITGQAVQGHKRLTSSRVVKGRSARRKSAKKK